MKIGVCGASGRMGRAVVRMSLDAGHTVSGAFEAATSPAIGSDAGVLANGIPCGVKIQTLSNEGIGSCDVIVDFSSPKGTMALLDLAVEKKIAVVVCPTGFDEVGKSRIMEASHSIPVLFSPNMSIGVNVMFKLIESASKALSKGFDIEVFESHHRMKKDAPSGTARKMLDVIKGAIPRLSNAREVYGREGITGERTDNEIGVQVQRGGDIVGEHTVFYISSEERIEITHRAATREVFAKGAIRAAEYIAGKKAGRYSMDDVLGL